MRDLASDDRKKRDKALYELYGNVYHQGTVYEVTPHVVPFLLRMLDGPARLEILAYLSALAGGHGETLEVEAGTRQALLAGRDHYVQLLEARDAQVRIAVSYLLGYLAGHTLDELAACLERESDPQVRASLWLALGCAEGTETRLESAREDSDPLCRLCGAMSLVRRLREKAPGWASEAMIAALADEELARRYESLPWNDGGLHAELAGLLLLGHVDEARLALLLEVFGQVTNALGALALGEALLSAHGDRPQVWQALAGSEAFWLFNANAGVILSRFGLPAARGELKRRVFDKNYP